MVKHPVINDRKPTEQKYAPGCFGCGKQTVKGGTFVPIISLASILCLYEKNHAWKQALDPGDPRLYIQSLYICKGSDIYTPYAIGCSRFVSIAVSEQLEPESDDETRRHEAILAPDHNLTLADLVDAVEGAGPLPISSPIIPIAEEDLKAYQIPIVPSTSPMPSKRTEEDIQKLARIVSTDYDRVTVKTLLDSLRVFSNHPAQFDMFSEHGIGLSKRWFDSFCEDSQNPIKVLRVLLVGHRPELDKSVR